MLTNSPNLEDLSISYNPSSPLFESCRFPLLVKLHLFPEYSASNPGQNLLAADLLIVDFLVAHPTIEDLRWYPIDQGLPIPSGLLPRLKRILTNHRMATSILRDPSVIQGRKMELISQISLGPNTRQLLETIDGSRLQEMHIWGIDNAETLPRVASLFPNIRTLVIPNFGGPFGHRSFSGSFDECVECLASFPALENIKESSLWFAIQALNGQEKLNAPLKLATRCRRLKRLNHHSSSTNIHEIIFKRTERNITWSEQVNHDDEAL
ncbi:hypothetical protein M413DRAFT_449801 [Hebeloma cylindrosporum]|uniref:F-box domain-containing protein n=1 Tax=Hebeloma cylindrosporum TaxID=76867 RepID=A0A0C2Y2U1_HEBCY|nr:hypothetical protein M413DRAFT_449801 [Hebeloma cylindrosporum h7]